MPGACKSVSNVLPVVLECGTSDNRKYKSFTSCLVMVAGYLVCTRVSCRKGDRIKVCFNKHGVNISGYFLEHSTDQLPWDCLHCRPEGCATSVICSQKRHQESAQAGAGLKAGRSNPYHGQPPPMVTPLPALEDQVAAARQQFDDISAASTAISSATGLWSCQHGTHPRTPSASRIPKQRPRCQWWCA